MFVGDRQIFFGWSRDFEMLLTDKKFQILIAKTQTIAGILIDLVWITPVKINNCIFYVLFEHEFN